MNIWYDGTPSSSILIAPYHVVDIRRDVGVAYVTQEEVDSLFLGLYAS